MASPDTYQKLAEHPDWIAPRSDTRVFLGEPGAPEATKTTLEPGNAFSPGMLTFGVTWWLRFPGSDRFFATETAALDTMTWRYEDGFLPLVHCATTVDGVAVDHGLFQDGTAADRSEAVCGRLALTNTAAAPVLLQLFIALRSLGPAGGPVPALAVGPDGRSFWLPRRNLPLLAVDRPPDRLGCGVGDPSPLARRGIVPSERSAQDPDGWCFGVMRFDLSLPPDGTWRVDLDCPLQTYGNLEDELPGTAALRPERIEARRDVHLRSWRTRLGHIGLDVPDQDFRNAFFAGLQHMLTASVGDQARIAPLSYPLPWLRDSIFIIRCVDLAGLHGEARRLTEYCARNDFFGGFGAEGDAPGQGIWALVQHHRLTADRPWLEQVYPAIRRKCEWLFRMRRADGPIQIVVDTPTLAYTHAERTSGVICAAARDGIITGSMDHRIDHSVGWVNHWALCGLREAAHAARLLGHLADAIAYEAEAEQLMAVIERFAERVPGFFAHDRTVNSLLWPTRAWERTPDRVEDRFDDWWRANRGTAGEFKPEPYWLYFEFAQAHNALLLGQRERAWDVIGYRMRHQDVPGLYGWREGGAGVGTRNATQGVTLFNQLRGCHRFDDITPHGWSQAEMWLLQRAVLVEEWQGGLLLFAGVPSDWLTPGARVAFRDWPTWYGRVTAELRVDEEGKRATITATGIAAGTRVEARVTDHPVVLVGTGGTLSVAVNLDPVDGDRA